MNVPIPPTLVKGEILITKPFFGLIFLPLKQIFDINTIYGICINKCIINRIFGSIIFLKNYEKILKKCSSSHALNSITYAIES